MYVYFVYKCEPLCEIQAEVSKPNYEKTSIKVWFLPLISLWFQSLTLPYSVNIKDIKVKFTQYVLFHIKYDFCRKKTNYKKMTLSGFSQRGSQILTQTIYILHVLYINIFNI